MERSRNRLYAAQEKAAPTHASTCSLLHGQQSTHSFTRWSAQPVQVGCHASVLAHDWPGSPYPTAAVVKTNAFGRDPAGVPLDWDVADDPNPKSKSGGRRWRRAPPLWANEGQPHLARSGRRMCSSWKDCAYHRWTPTNDEIVWYLGSQTTRKPHTIIVVEKNFDNCMMERAAENGVMPSNMRDLAHIQRETSTGSAAMAICTASVTIGCTRSHGYM